MTTPDAVADGLRSADPDRYVSVLYAPEDKRAALTALYAFNAEIASVRDRISEPLPGEVRLQWWRDVLEAGTVEAAAGHPVAMALVDAIQRYNLPVKALTDMLEARIFDLYDDPMPSRADLEGYCGETASALLQLASLILDPKAAALTANQAGHAGCAQAIGGLLRLTPLHRSRGQCYIPADILQAAGTNAADFVAGKDEAAANRAMQAMLALARDHWAAFQRAPAVPATLQPAFQPAMLTPLYLDALERAGASALRTPVTVPAWRRQLSAFMRTLRSR